MLTPSYFQTVEKWRLLHGKKQCILGAPKCVTDWACFGGEAGQEGGEAGWPPGTWSVTGAWTSHCPPASRSQLPAFIRTWSHSLRSVLTTLCAGLTVLQTFNATRFLLLIVVLQGTKTVPLSARALPLQRRLSQDGRVKAETVLGSSHPE